MALVKANPPGIPAVGDGKPTPDGPASGLPPLIETGPSVEDLLAALDAEESTTRRSAARALATHPEAAMALCDRVEIERSPSVRVVLFTTLIRLQSPEIAARLAGLLRSEDVALRNGAIEALQEMPAAVAPSLRALLADPDSDVRLFAVNILGALCHESAPEWLVEVIASEPHVNVCAAAVDALAEVGRPEAVPALQALRARFPDEPFMTFAIDTAVRRIEGR
ncbi:HEAT repeat domain-containing protein [Pararhodospirillum oryzae]|uniref:PBS lyase n=1 Tax=Pararhodospirillum oryzae TaxID=478448 RepID=A0A512H7H9_9PROT|nr:HEAT repeat domain-containing protein [Pararhodospirillum oryzae]GEO81340.1 PBS lyase [Pararhodospirillum oryzae]